MFNQLVRPIALVLMVILLTLPELSALTVQAEHPGDEFIQGYATAVVAMNYPAGVESITVEDGVVYLRGVSLSEEDKTELSKILSDVKGVIRLEFVPQTRRSEKAAGSSAKANEAAAPAEVLPMLLPKSLLFQPLLADPRWPHFSASFQRYLNDSQLRNAASTNFGESIGLYRLRGPLASTIQLGIQAGVFSIFDLDSSSFDLINADYMVGLPLTFKKGNFTNMTRVFHQSSHLGDEYLLRSHSNKRVNLSYESVNSLFSYHLPAGFRLYAGGGYIFHKDPADLDPWSTQAGLEFRSPVFWWDGALRPVAGVDIQQRQESNWNPDISARTGIQFENPEFLSRKMQLLFEYYNGKSPNGQFYERNIELFGLGLHFFFE